LTTSTMCGVRTWKANCWGPFLPAWWDAVSGRRQLAIAGSARVMTLKSKFHFKKSAHSDPMEPWTHGPMRSLSEGQAGVCVFRCPTSAKKSLPVGQGLERSEQPTAMTNAHIEASGSNPCTCCGCDCDCVYVLMTANVNSERR
jgi:hypothetical protein